MEFWRSAPSRKWLVFWCGHHSSRGTYCVTVYPCSHACLRMPSVEHRVRHGGTISCHQSMSLIPAGFGGKNVPVMKLGMDSVVSSMLARAFA